jgi:DNA-binding transcriptional MerR regulator
MTKTEQLREPPWKIGEVARNTGTSVRALHHYDDIGLLSPTHRTRAGHRLYSRSDIERLQQIQSLRMAGFALTEAKELLDRGTSTREVIDLHLTRLHQQIATHQRVAGRLRALAARMDTDGPIPLHEICKAIEAMMQTEKYFTPEQLEVLDARRKAAGEARMKSVGDDWAKLIAAVGDRMDTGADPLSPEVMALARQWKALVHEFTGGDPAIANAVKTMYQHEGAEIRREHGNIPTPEMFAYIGKSLAALSD